MKKFYLTSGLLFILGTFLMSQTPIGGTFTNNTTLTSANSPYVVTNDISVNAGVTLTIETGVEVRFNAGKYIVVYGTMMATGATFTANSSTAKGFWDGFYVGYEWGTDYGQITLNNCQVEYATSLRVRKGDLTLTNNTVLRNFSSYGVDIYTSGNATIDQTTIQGCSYPVYFRGDGSMNLGTGIDFTGNTTDYIFINFQNINGNFVCDNPGIPYYFDSQLNINPGGLLQLNAGVHLLGNTGAWISVSGKMKALGTAVDSVILDREPANSYWLGMNFNDASVDTACIFNYTRFSGAQYNWGNAWNSNWPYSAVEVNKSSPEFTHCTFSGNLFNLVVTGKAAPVFRNCNFTPSVTSLEQTMNINMDMNASPLFDSCTINFNSSEGRAIGLMGSLVYDNAHLKQISFNNLSNITYTLEGQVTIHDTASMAIDSGIVIKCRNNNTFISAAGPLTAIGTATQPIIFTHINDDTYGNPKDTHNNGTGTINPSTSGRLLLTGAGASHLKYWKILYAGYSSTNYAVVARGNSTIENCEIKHSYSGILFSDNAQILNNLFENIGTYPLARDVNAGNPVLIGNSVNNIGHMGIYLNSFQNGTYSFGGMDFAGNSNVAYILNKTVSIPNTADVTFLPGTVLKFYGYYNTLQVHGGIKADGLPGNRIIFTSIYDNSVSGNTNFNGGNDPVGYKWGGIVLASDAHDTFNSMSNCEIRYVSNGITIENSKISMTSVLLNFSDNYGLNIYGTADPVITNCAFNNLNNAPVYMDLFASPVFSGNSAANVGQMGIAIRGGTVSGTVPVRSFAGYDTITYLINENLRVDNQLTIPAGLVFKSWGNNYFNIYGKLNVAGTAGNPVVFTTLNDDSYGNPGDTQFNGPTSIAKTGCRIVFNPESNDSSRVDYALFRYSNYYGINLTNASPKISNTTFYKARLSGMLLSGTSQPEITSSVFEDLPFPITLSLLSFPALDSNNVLTGTTGKGLEVVDNETLTQNFLLRKRNFAGITNIPYIFYRYTIGTSAVLSVEPGVILKFKPGGYINVRNGLIANGGSSPDSTIVFTADEDDFYGGDTYGNGNNTPSNQWWYGIYFAPESIDGSSLLDNCVVRFASAVYSNNPYSANRAAVTMNNASPTITNTLFEDDYWGILTRNTCVPLIDSCNFSRMQPTYGYGIWNETNTVAVKAENCWWNDNSGPYHPVLNPGGTGERVSDSVDFIPWISAPSKPVMGDVSLNGEVMPYDASLVLQHTVGNITLNGTQLSVADVSHDNTVSSYDASLILQYVVGLITGFDGGGKKSFLTGEMILAEGPVGPFMADTSTIEIPIWLTTAENVKALEMTLTSDPEHIRFAGIRTDELPTNIMFASGYNEQTGDILLSCASAYDLSLVRSRIFLTFEVRNGNVHESLLSLEKLKANETVITDPLFSLSVNSSNTVTGLENKQYNGLKLYGLGGSLIADFDLPTRQQEVTVEIYDASGRKTNHLQFVNLPAGSQHLIFKAERDNSHNPLKIYIVTIRGKDLHLTRKIVLR